MDPAEERPEKLRNQDPTGTPNNSMKMEQISKLDGMSLFRRAVGRIREFRSLSPEICDAFDILLDQLERRRSEKPKDTTCEVRLGFIGKNVDITGEAEKNHDEGLKDLAIAVQRLAQENLDSESIGEEEIIIALGSLAEILRINAPDVIEGVTLIIRHDIPRV